MTYSSLDQIYRSILLSKYFVKGWGKPDSLKRLEAVLQLNPLVIVLKLWLMVVNALFKTCYLKRLIHPRWHHLF